MLSMDASPEVTPTPVCPTADTVHRINKTKSAVFMAFNPIPHLVNATVMPTQADSFSYIYKESKKCNASLCTLVEGLANCWS